MRATKHDDHERPWNSPTHTAEIWRGKGDPGERRRVQNRMNQRAFRSRQRAGKATRTYKPRCSADRATGNATVSPSVEREQSPSPGPCVSSWDELGQLINHNFMAAAVKNAALLGIDIALLRSARLCLTPRAILRAAMPPCLVPIKLQYEVPHDAIIDILPHPRLRHNILQGIAAGSVNQDLLGQVLRQSGSLQRLRGDWYRDGIILWGSAEDCANWEFSDLLYIRWHALLDGCDDLITATNAWRLARGLRPFHVSRIKQELPSI